METMKINKLEIENVKRVKAVKLEPMANGLTIIGGDNNQGKTSVLDSIAWASAVPQSLPSAPQTAGTCPLHRMGARRGQVPAVWGDRKSVV